MGDDAPGADSFEEGRMMEKQQPLFPDTERACCCGAAEGDKKPCPKYANGHHVWTVIRYKREERGPR